MIDPRARLRSNDSVNRQIAILLTLAVLIVGAILSFEIWNVPAPIVPATQPDPIRAYFSPSSDAPQAVIDAISNTRTTLEIAAYSFIHTNDTPFHAGLDTVLSVDSLRTFR